MKTSPRLSLRRAPCCCGPAPSPPSPSRCRGLGPAGLAVARLAVASAALALRRAADWACAGPGQGPAADRAVRAGRDDRVPAAAQRRGAGGARGDGQPAVATAPVYASLLAVAFLGEQPGRRRWAGSAVALAGTALIAVSHGLGFGASALIVLAAAVLQGIFHTAQKPLLARYTGFEVTAYAMWAGTAFILPWTGSLLSALPQAGGAAIGSAVFLGLAPSAGGFVLWAYAMARMDVGRVTLSLYLVPAAAILISLAWLGQVRGRPSWSAGRSRWPGSCWHRRRPYLHGPTSHGPTSHGSTSHGRASGVAAGDEDRGRRQARRPARPAGPAGTAPGENRSAAGCSAVTCWAASSSVNRPIRPFHGAAAGPG